MNIIPPNKIKTFKGQALIEFLMILPFLILIFSGIFEIYSFINLHQQIMTISNEAGRSAFKDCASLNVPEDLGPLSTEKASLPNELNLCLDQISSKMQEFKMAFPPYFDKRGAIIVSVYDWKEDKIRLKGRGSHEVINSFSSRYSLVGGNQKVNEKHVKDFPEIVIAEVFYHYVLVSPFGALINLFTKDKASYAPTTIYEVTIL